MPAAQGVHAVAPLESDVDPAGHTEHASAPDAAAYVEGAHRVQAEPEAGLAEPGAHAAQDVKSADEVLPAAQATHDESPAPAAA